MKRALIITAVLMSSAVHAQTYKDVWDDVRKPWRPDAQMQEMVEVDGAACDREVGPIKGMPSARYRACMRRHDWKFSHLERLPWAPADAESDSSPPDDWQSRMDDDLRREAEQQQMFDQQQQQSTEQMLLDQQQNINAQQHINGN
jgi:hypothetical protein